MRALGPRASGLRTWAAGRGGAFARALGLGAALLSSGARADDVRIAGFVARESGTYVLDEPAYDAFLRDALAALAPSLGVTGATSGTGGFELALGLGWQPVAPSSAAWRDALGADAPSALTAFTLSARKGLPENLELGAHFAHVDAIAMTSGSLELGWAIVGGEELLPDIGVRIDIGGVFGNADATLLHGGASLVVGKGFAIAGLVRLAPYAGYRIRIGQTIARRVTLLEAADATPFETTLPSQSIQLHEGVVGVRTDFAPLDLVLEGYFGTASGLRVSLVADL